MVGARRTLESHIRQRREHDGECLVRVEHEHRVGQLEPGEVEKVDLLSEGPTRCEPLRTGREEHSTSGLLQLGHHGLTAQPELGGGEGERGPIEEALLRRPATLGVLSGQRPRRVDQQRRQDGDRESRGHRQSSLDSHVPNHGILATLREGGGCVRTHLESFRLRVCRGGGNPTGFP